MLTIAELSAFCKTTFEASSVLVASGQEHMPLLVIGSVEDDGFRVRGMIGLAVDKDDQVEVISRYKRQCGPRDFCAFVCEAWMAPAKTEVVDAAKLKVRDMPEAEEVIMFSVYGADFEYRAFWPIDRERRALKFEELHSGALDLGRFALTPAGGSA